MKMTFRFGLVDMSDTTASKKKKKPTDAVRATKSDDVEQQAGSCSSQAKAHSVIHTQLPT